MTPLPPRPTRSAALSCAVVLAVTLSGCVAVGEDLATPAGGGPPPRTLRIGMDDPEGRPASDLAVAFADLVAERSGGRLVIEPVFEANGEADRPSWDQEVARQVVSGDLDLGVVPARAWDTEGVDSLRALHAPGLLDSDEDLVTVLADEELTGDLLAGLADVGVTGLVLAPEGMRRWFAVDTDEITADSVQGAVVRSPRSDTTWAVLRAMGADPRDVGEEWSAYETGLALAYTLPPARVVAGNLPLYPKVNSLVVNTTTYDRLPEDLQQVLVTVGQDLQARSLVSMPEESAAAAEYCREGGRVAVLAEAELERLRRAAEPVTAALREDAGTAAAMDRIEQLVAGGSPQVIAPCGSPRVDAGTLEADGGDLPDGTYRVEFTEEYLESFGYGREHVTNNAGLWTITMTDGLGSVEQQMPDGSVWQGTFRYRASGSDLHVQYTDEPADHLTWRVDEQGRLVFEVVSVVDDALFHYALPWTPVT